MCGGYDGIISEGEMGESIREGCVLGLVLLFCVGRHVGGGSRSGDRTGFGVGVAGITMIICE